MGEGVQVALLREGNFRALYQIEFIFQIQPTFWVLTHGPPWLVNGSMKRKPARPAWLSV